MDRENLIVEDHVFSIDNGSDTYIYNYAFGYTDIPTVYVENDSNPTITEGLSSVEIVYPYNTGVTNAKLVVKKQAKEELI